MKVFKSVFFKQAIAACLLCALACAFAQEAEQAGIVQNELSESQRRENEQFSSFLTGEGEESASGGDTPASDVGTPPQVGVGSFIRMLLVLALIVVAIYLVFRFVKKSSTGGQGQPEDDDVFLRKVSRVGLGAGQSVQIVTLWDKAFVLGVSDGAISLIKEIDDKELVDAMNRFSDMNATVKKPRTFEEILNLFSKGKAGFAQLTKAPAKKSAYDEKTMSLIASLKARRLSSLDETQGGSE